MDTRDMDAKVAELLFGWSWWVSESSLRRGIFPPPCPPPWFKRRADGTEHRCADWDWGLPHYTTSPQRDYEVLEKVREDADLCCRVRDNANLIWEMRAMRQIRDGSLQTVFGWTQYRPGDWAYAYLIAKGVIATTGQAEELRSEKDSRGGAADRDVKPLHVAHAEEDSARAGI